MTEHDQQKGVLCMKDPNTGVPEILRAKKPGAVGAAASIKRKYTQKVPSPKYRDPGVLEFENIC